RGALAFPRIETANRNRTSTRRRTHMAHASAGLIPHIVVDNGPAAIEFYKKGLGATEKSRMPAPDGKRVMHAEVEINGMSVYLSDDFPEYCGGKSRTPKAYGGSPI